MERRDFLKGLIVAAMAAAISPIVPPIGSYRRFVNFKISNDLLDHPRIKELIQEIITELTPVGYKATQVELGIHEDDFSMDVTTCRFELIKI